jgi:putative heme-binding domain-containing protein
MLRGLLLAQAQDTEIQSTISRALSDQHTPVDTRLLLLQVIARSPARPTPDVWRDPVIAGLVAKDSMIVDQAIAAVAACGFEDGDQVLLQIAEDDARVVETRVAAAAVLATRPLPLPANVFKLLVEHSRAEAAPLIRLQAASALEDATLDMEQLRAVSGIVSQAGPLELRGLMRAFELPDQDQAASNPDLAPIGMLLLRALEQSPGLQSIMRSDLEKLFARYPEEVQASAQALMAKLAMGQQEMTAQIDELERSLTDGDPNRGSQVFFGSRAACSVCHRLQGAGGTVGPDLTGIGTTRTRRDLLDSIVVPSASFARGYESFSVITSEGTVYSGVITRRTAEKITLQTGERKEIQIRAEDVDELAPSSVSIMPQGLEKLLTPDELSDLLAYLSRSPDVE